MAPTIDHQLATYITDVASEHVTARIDADGGKAAAAIAQAMISAAINSGKPAAFLQCSPESIAACVMASMSTGLYPGGHHPLVYLVPKARQLQWRITARGIATMLQRAGYRITYTHVSSGDDMVFDMGQVISHTPANRRSLPTWDSLDGVIVGIYRLSDGHRIAADWVPRSVIEDRRRASDMPNSGPWATWTMEMASKTAAIYLSGRGSLPQVRELEDAIRAERSTIIDAATEEDTTPAPRRTVALPTGTTPRALPAPAAIPESRQLASPAPDAEWTPAPAPDPIPAPVQAPAPARTAAPEWAAALKPELAALVRATGARSVSDALKVANITVPESPDVEILRDAITEATTAAQERDAPAAR